MAEVEAVVVVGVSDEMTAAEEVVVVENFVSPPALESAGLRFSDLPCGSRSHTARLELHTARQ